MADYGSFFSKWLAHEEKLVLYKLIQLADGQIGNYEGNTGRRKPGSQPPPRKVGLYAWHEKKLAEARSKYSDCSNPVHRRERMSVVNTAEQDYWIAKKRPPVYNDPDPDVNKKERDEAIVAFQGERSALWVANWMGCSVAHVYRLWKARKEKNVTPQA